jgi:putative SOS response-associated peptidase YedK
VHRDRYVPRYNVAPRTHAPVIRRAQPEEPALVMHSMRWGLVPHWSKAEPPALNTINARSENLEEGGGIWGSVKGRKRCVVVAQGCVPPRNITHAP